MVSGFFLTESIKGQLMSQEYARIINGIVVEVGVLEQHIINRGHAKAMYVPVVDEVRPTVPVEKLAIQKLSVTENSASVIRKWEVVDKDPVVLLEDLWYETVDDQVRRREELAFADVPAGAWVALTKGLDAHVKQSLNAFAGSRGYTLDSAMTYIGSHIAAYDREARIVRFFRDEMYHRLYQYIAEVEKGELSFPGTFAAITGRLPTLTWDVLLPGEVAVEEPKLADVQAEAPVAETEIEVPAEPVAPAADSEAVAVVEDEAPAAKTSKPRKS